MDLGRLLREAIRRGPTNVAAAVNVDRSGQTTVAYSDDRGPIVSGGGQETRVDDDAGDEAGD